MAFSGLLDNLNERWQPAKARLFPSQVLFQLGDDALIGQSFDGHSPTGISIEAQIPPSTCQNGLPMELEPLGDLIGDLLVNDGLLDAYVLAALPPAATEWRVIAWPFDELPAEPLESLRQLNPSLGLSTTLDDTYIDLQPLPGHPAEMLLAASSRALVEAWVEVFNLAGVQLERLTPAQSCQMAALAPLLRQAAPGQLIALLDPQPDHCRLVLFRAALPVFDHRLPPLANQLMEELHRCLSFYRREDPQARELRLLLAQPMPIQERLEQELGLTAEVVPCGPFRSLVLKGLATPEVEG